MNKVTSSGVEDGRSTGTSVLSAQGFRLTSVDDLFHAAASAAGTTDDRLKN